jgi:hypothetical protein
VQNGSPRTQTLKRACSNDVPRCSSPMGEAQVWLTHGRGPGLAGSSKMCEYDLRGNGRQAKRRCRVRSNFLQDCLG